MKKIKRILITKANRLCWYANLTGVKLEITKEDERGCFVNVGGLEMFIIHHNYKIVK